MSNERRMTDLVGRDRAEDSCRLVREVRLQHAAPIIDIQVCVDPLSKVGEAATDHLAAMLQDDRLYILEQDQCNFESIYVILNLPICRISFAVLAK